MRTIYIAGTGDMAREIFHASQEQNKIGEETFRVEGFLDPVQSEKKMFEGRPVLRIDALDPSTAGNMNCIIGIGTPRYIQVAQEMMTAKGVRNWINVVHPRAYLAPGVQLGKGIYIAPHATIAIAASIGDFTVINQNVSVGHDVLIGQHCVVSPSCVISGRCHLSERVFLGSGAILLPGIKVRADAHISPNCVVAKDVSARVKVMVVTRNIELPREL